MMKKMPKKLPKETKAAIRNQYQDLGVDAFYQEHGASYSNPHFSEIAKLLRQNESRINYSIAFDFCCGSGEVSRVLADLGYAHTEASDPFTQEAYQKNLGKTCYSYSFEDIIKKPLPKQYSCIICSFAMHLCPKGQLFPLVYHLFQSTQQLIIITPHKRPALETLDGVSLKFEDFTLTKRRKKVRLKAYGARFTQSNLLLG